MANPWYVKFLDPKNRNPDVYPSTLYGIDNEEKSKLVPNNPTYDSVKTIVDCASRSRLCTVTFVSVTRLCNIPLPHGMLLIFLHVQIYLHSSKCISPEVGPGTGALHVSFIRTSLGYWSCSLAVPFHFLRLNIYLHNCN